MKNFNSHFQTSIVRLDRLILAIFIIAMGSVFCSQSRAQSSYYIVKGKVVDKNNQAPLQGASVFAQNTTFGVATDADGNFTIKLPTGGYSIAVTYTGYETESVRVNNTSPENDSLVLGMNPQTKSLEEVTVAISSEVKDGWQKYGEFFTKNFIGQSAYAKQTSIKNPEILHFYFSKKRNRLKVLATEPVTVQNDALGYILHFAIDSFTYEYANTTSLFIGYPLFEEMQGTPEQMDVWRKNRLAAYQGSMLQFMRSLYNQTLSQSGYEVQFLVNNGSEDVPVPLQDIYAALNFQKDDSTQVAEIHPALNSIAVIYKNVRPEISYLANDSLANKNFQLSRLLFPQTEPLFIEQNGYYFDQTDLVTNGYFGFKKIGDMLPYDYSAVVTTANVIGGKETEQ
ncbi:MAG: carboxypeptidase-like regulatory domain-containing protein [Ginsengibacter sp.]